MRKKIVAILALLFVLVGCGVSSEEYSDLEETEKYTEMTESGVMAYLMQMTNMFSNAYTTATTEEKKIEYLNEAITDINLAVYEIEDKYEEGTPPTDDFFKLANVLKDTIDNEMLGENNEAYENARKAGKLIGDISNNYLDGELPPALKFMIENK